MEELQQQFDMLQKYISTIFSSLPAISPHTQSALLLQTIHYGKKIIELSDKFTAKYRKEHMIDRKDIEQKIKEIYSLVVSFSSSHSFEIYSSQTEPLNEIVTKILTILREEICLPEKAISRLSNAQSNSRMSYHPLTNQTIKYKTEKNKESQYLKLQFEENQNKLSSGYETGKKFVSNGPEMSKKKRSSTNKSTKKGANQPLDGKTVLTIKKVFQEEQIEIQKLFQKISKIVYSNPQMNVSALEQKLSFSSKHQNSENSSEQLNYIDIMKGNVKNNINKLHDLQNAIKVLDQHFERKVKMEGYSQGKFNLYLDQINKREEVYSYSVSKLLEAISNLRDQFEGQTNISVNTLNNLDNLQELSNKFYDLYPSHSIMKDLKVQKLTKQLQKVGFQNQAIQVNIGKSQKAITKEITQSRRNLLELYRVTSKISEFIERFERNIKYKKNVENKEVQKFVQMIKDSLPKKNGSINANNANIPSSIREEVSSYQEELKKIMELHEKNEKEINQDFSKKSRKMQKKMNELEKVVEEITNQLMKQKEHRETEKKKLQKKIENQKQENKKLHVMNNKLEKSINELSLELQRLKSELRDQYEKYVKSEQILKENERNLGQKLLKAEETNQILSDEIEEIQNKYEEERQIYHKKILILESSEESNGEELIKTKEELANVINDSKKLQKQINELTEIYEQKIKELQYVIENIKELQEQIKHHQANTHELQTHLQQIQAKLDHQIANKNILEKQNTRMVKQLEQKIEDVEKFRNLAVLNQNDIEVLREEIEKVKDAYFQADDLCQQLKTHSGEVERDRERLRRENREYKLQIDQYSEKVGEFELVKSKLERQINVCREELSLKFKESDGNFRDLQVIKRDFSKSRRQNQDLRDHLAKCEADLRLSREELTKKVETQSLESSKRKLEIEGAKVQIRRKTQQLEKQRAVYEQKIEMLQKKNIQLSQLITQRQLLTKITNSHLSQ